MELCPQLGISIPVGKDSMSMKTVWQDGGDKKEVTAPLSLIISAFAPCSDARKTLTPELRRDAGETDLILIDLGRGRNRLGGSALAQVYGQIGNAAPDVLGAAQLKAFFQTVQRLNRDNKILAYHDRSDGGLFVTVCEMMFASHTGVTAGSGRTVHRADPARGGAERGGAGNSGRGLQRAHLQRAVQRRAGAVLQVRRSDTAAVMDAFFTIGAAQRIARHRQPERERQPEPGAQRRRGIRF